MDEEHVRWPVRLWWAAEDKAPWLLPAERVFWRAAHAVRYPAAHYAYWRKWHARPKPGQKCLEHGTPRTVTRVDGDRIEFEGGGAASWMNCCDPVPKGGQEAKFDETDTAQVPR